MQHNLVEILHAVKVLSFEVGAYIQGELQSEVEIIEKGFNNFVSRVDKTAEEMFVAGLSKIVPEAGFITEEGTSSIRGDRYHWVVDPLDGTTNFLYRIPFYCTSVALLDHSTPVLGVIYAPSLNECFYASKGNGAFLNDQPISVAKTQDLNQALIATGFPYEQMKENESYMLLLNHLIQNTRGIRRLGSAALDLAYVACSRFEVFYEYGLNPWDVAAGIIIVLESGGEISGFERTDNALFGNTIIASNGRIHEQMLSTIQSHFHQ